VGRAGSYEHVQCTLHNCSLLPASAQNKTASCRLPTAPHKKLLHCSSDAACRGCSRLKPDHCICLPAAGGPVAAVVAAAPAAVSAAADTTRVLQALLDPAHVPLTGEGGAGGPSMTTRMRVSCSRCSSTAPVRPAFPYKVLCTHAASVGVTAVLVCSRRMGGHRGVTLEDGGTAHSWLGWVCLHRTPAQQTILSLVSKSVIAVSYLPTHAHAHRFSEGMMQPLPYTWGS
jgi:hypothetical protein